MKNIRRALLFIGLIVAAIGGWLYFRGDRMTQLVGGRQAMDIVARPDEVHAFRLGAPADLYDSSVSEFATYPRTAGPVTLSKATVAKLSGALLSPGTYAWEYGKACRPQYGVLLTFSQRDDSVDVLFCFECDMLLFGRNSEAVGGEDFDFGRAVFVAAAKECFPDDQEIQALNEER